MSRKEKYSIDDSADVQNQEMMNEYDLSDEDFFKKYEKPSRRNSRRSKESRRRIDEYQEKKALEAKLDEYYFHTDD